MFLCHPDPAPDPYIIKQNSNKNCDFLWLLFGFLSLKNDVNVTLKSNKQNNLEKKIPVAVLKVTDENSRIRIRNTDNNH